MVVRSMCDGKTCGACGSELGGDGDARDGGSVVNERSFFSCSALLSCFGFFPFLLICLWLMGIERLKLGG